MLMLLIWHYVSLLHGFKVYHKHAICKLLYYEASNKAF